MKTLQISVFCLLVALTATIATAEEAAAQKSDAEQTHVKRRTRPPRHVDAEKKTEEIIIQESDDPEVELEIVISSTLPEEHGLPVFSNIADFTANDSRGGKLSLKDLRGKVWVADFVFTRCGGPCPTMTAGLAELQAIYTGSEDVRFVTFTVDPDFDSPLVLRHYAKKYDADTDLWLFLQTTYEETYRLAMESFLVGVRREGAYVDELGNVYNEEGAVIDKIEVPEGKFDDAAENSGEAASEVVESDGKILKKKFVATEIIHSTKYILVDQVGQVRGYYEGVERNAAKRLVHDIDLLLDNPPAEPDVDDQAAESNETEQPAPADIATE